MKQYDDLNLLNCGLMMPWNANDIETARGSGLLRMQLRIVFPQKSSIPPPGHVWGGISSMDDLRVRTAATLDELRMRLLQMLLSEVGDGDVRKAENAVVSTAAAAQGIMVDRQPQLQNTAGVQS
jgi:hypothetical protein